MSHGSQNLIPDFVLQKYSQGKLEGEFKAATLFVDISGFTKLTETFLTHHREGAEALTNALRQIFTPQIDILYERGGFIPFFAGDAFVAIFPYDDPEFGQEAAAVQAVKTAVQIQQYVCQEGDQRLIETKHGTFGFGVKIGLSFGSIRWGIPGLDDQRTFYFRGPAINGCADSEKRAETGQIVLDDAIMGWVREGVTVRPFEETPHHLLLHENLPESSPNERSRQKEEILHPIFLPEQIIHLQVNEFREVSTIFISFEAPQQTNAFHDFINKVMDTLNQYGGYLNQIDVGDKGSLLVILFGAPVAYENNLLRAAGFLQKMHEHQLNIPWRAGMTFGLLWAGIRGGGDRCEYGVVGNEINLAARLAMKAEWGQILVSDVVYRKLKDAYLFYSLGNMEIKGKSEVINAYLFYYRYDSVDFHDYQGQLIGRESELTQLEQITHTVFQENRSRLVYIHGDTGVGKTRLIFELRRKILYRYFPQSFYCPADEIQRTSLNPFRRFLRHYFGLKPDLSVDKNKEMFDQQFDFLLSQLDGEQEETAQLTLELERTRSILGAMVDLYWEGSLYEKLDPKLRFENTQEAMRNLVKAATHVRPVILHIEDAQWLDDDSIGLLQSLAYGLRDRAFLVICTCRYLDEGETVQFDFAPEVESAEIHLDQLSTEDVTRMIETYMNTAVSPEVGRFLAEKTDGNPFFIEQLLADLMERNALPFTSGETSAEMLQNAIRVDDIPTSVNTLLLSRLDRLDYQVKSVVRAASVLGTQFELPVLREMLNAPDQFQQLVKIAEKQQIWFAQNSVTYQFKHALLRDASYAMQLKSDIRDHHRLAGQAIETVHYDDLASHYSTLAFHAHKGELSNVAIKWYQLAGEKAASQYANSEALQYVDQALTLNEGKDVRKEVALRLIREKTLGLQGVRDSQKMELDHLMLLVDSLEDLPLQTAVSHRLAKYAEDTGDYSSVLAHATETTKLARSCNDQTHLVAALLLQGKAYYRKGAYDEAYYWLKEGLAQAQIHDLPSYEAHSLRQIGIVLVDESQYDEAETYYKKALAIYDAIGDKTGLGTTLNNIGVLKWLAGDIIGAQDFYNQAFRLYEEIGYRRGKNMALMNLGLLFAAYGDYEKSQSFYEQAIKNLEAINERFGVCVARLNLTDVYLHQSNYDLAHETSRLVYHQAEEIGARRIVGIALSRIGASLRGKQKLVGSEKAFNDAIDLWQQMQQPDLEMEARAGLALLYLDKNDPHAAKDEIKTVVAYLAKNEDRQSQISEIVQILFSCYQVLHTLCEPDASTLLRQAYDVLHENAAKISEPSLRQRFLKDVPLHCQIVQAFSKLSTVHETNIDG